MGLRFHKSFKILPGVKLNINKKSVGVTLGTKGAHYTINSSGKRTASVSLPGTGLSYSTSTSGKSKDKEKTDPKAKANKLIRIGIAIAVLVCVGLAVKSSLDEKKAEKAAETAAITQTVENTAETTEMKTAGAAGSAAAGSMVWVSGSGSKYHSKSDCSGMEGAKQITLEEAQKDGKTACKRCY